MGDFLSTGVEYVGLHSWAGPLAELEGRETGGREGWLAPLLASCWPRPRWVSEVEPMISLSRESPTPCVRAEGCKPSRTRREARRLDYTALQWGCGRPLKLHELVCYLSDRSPRSLAQLPHSKRERFNELTKLRLSSCRGKATLAVGLENGIS